MAELLPEPRDMELEKTLKTLGVQRGESRRIREAFAVRHFKRDEVIFGEGDTADTFYFIESGRVLVSKRTQGGDDEPLSVLNPGQFFGEIGLLKGMERTATVKALNDLEVLALDRGGFDGLCRKSERFSSLLERVGRSRLLGQIPLFKELEAGSLDAIGELLIERSVPDGQVVFRQGDAPDAVYIIAKGAVRVSRQTPTGREVTLAQLGQGDFFGEMGLIEDQARSATVTTAEPCTLLAVRRGDFQTVLRQDARVACGVLKVLSRRLRKKDTEVALEKGASFFKGMTIIARADRCVSCRACEIACAVSKSRTHRLHQAIDESPLPVKRIHVRRTAAGSQPTIRPEHCLHCRDAPCLRSCRPGAITRDPVTGTIVIAEADCKGCGLCAKACPFDVITMIRSDGRKRMALKCTHCAEHREGPACVRSCPTNALVISLAPLAVA
jgi:CRP-like cAMP-binding protein